MNRKGAVELSANFLVVIIISIVILAAGIGLFYKLKGNAQTYVGTLDSQTQAKLKSMMLSNNYRVAVYPGDLDMGSGDAQLVGIGITNIYDAANSFSITVTGVKYYSTASATAIPITSSSTIPINKYAEPLTNTITIDPKDQQTKGLLIRMPDTRKGQYVYTIQVSATTPNSDPSYGLVQVYVYHQ